MLWLYNQGSTLKELHVREGVWQTTKILKKVTQFSCFNLMELIFHQAERREFNWEMALQQRCYKPIILETKMLLVSDRGGQQTTKFTMWFWILLITVAVTAIVNECLPPSLSPLTHHTAVADDHDGVPHGKTGQDDRCYPRAGLCSGKWCHISCDEHTECCQYIQHCVC